MATLTPFQALRPTPESAHLVAAVPYDVVTTEEARALAAGNALSFLHVSRAEIDLPSGTDPYSDVVYAAATSRFAALKRQAPLVREQSPDLYLYRLRMGAHEQVGVAGGYALDEYDRDIIKKHERTRRDKEDDRTRHMIELRAQTGPVFLTYRASVAVDTLVSQVTATDPLFEFTAVDGVRHALWRVPSQETQPLVAAFADVPTLYIADGHHRAASAARTRQNLRQAEQASTGGAATAVVAAGTLPYETLLAVAFPDNQVHILPYNRLVRDLNGLSPEAFLEAVKSRFDVWPGVPCPSRKGEISMYLPGEWHTLRTRRASEERQDVIGALDVSVLQTRLLDQVLGIVDVRTDPRVEFVGGARGTDALEQAVKGGKAAVAFSLFPVSVTELMAIADAGLIMPPKSTWFEPKLRDGLLIHEI
jgi:uncharacterized protein (DUF1015 family)